MNEQDLEKLKNGTLTTTELLSRDIPEDADILKVLKIFVEQWKVVSGEETNKFNREMQTKRFEEEMKLKKRELNSTIAKQKSEISNDQTKLDIEKTKLEIEKTRLDVEKCTLEMNIKKDSEEKKFRYISLAVTSVTGLLGIVIPLIVYRKLAYSNLKLIYKDEGRPTQDFKDAVRCVKGLTR